jgi:hypothetical protein
MTAPAPHKPYDFGDVGTSGAVGLTGSIDGAGRIIALNVPHPVHGYITLTAAAPFPETERYNPAAVRAYRAGLAALPGVGFAPPEGPPSTIHTQPDGAPILHVRRGESESITYASSGQAVQIVRVADEAPVWSGRVALMRCAYTQLTEGGPVPMPAVQTRARYADGRLIIENPALPAAAVIEGLSDPTMWERYTDGPIPVQIGGRAGENVLRYAIAPSVEAALAHLEAPAPTPDSVQAVWAAKLAELPPDPVLRRGLVYSLLMAVPDGAGACLLTDHMLLPLSWNRDAYYVARALLAWPGNRAEGQDVVRRHLLWMFEQAERRDGFWGRCYMANGRIKDGAFQLDQQLFPILELADYVLESGDRMILQRLQAPLSECLRGLMGLRLAGRHLFPTAETPADDPIAYPYHFSSHLLFWRVAQQLARIGVEGEWAALAESLRREIDHSFIAERDGKRLFAYATDGAGQFHLYHDANDLPFALAPAWEFCPATDPVWRETAAFAFSEANIGGYYGGRLGSVHTRAAWPLGDVQEWLIAAATGDSRRAEAVRARVQGIAQPDGSLPEAYDVATGGVVSRHWFAWPAAAYACVALGAFQYREPDPF